MQNAKDSFYEELRGRLAALNPERTVSVRGVTRPGLLVDENENGSVAGLPDCFHVAWTDVKAQEGALPVVAQTCEIRYSTAGSAMNGGLDRGRALAAMDAELLNALQRGVQNATKKDYAGLAHGGAAVVMATRIWWSEIAFGSQEAKADRVMRVATVQVMSLQEAGEI